MTRNERSAGADVFLQSIQAHVSDNYMTVNSTARFITMHHIGLELPRGVTPLSNSKTLERLYLRPGRVPLDQSEILRRKTSRVKSAIHFMPARTPILECVPSSGGKCEIGIKKYW